MDICGGWEISDCLEDAWCWLDARWCDLESGKHDSVLTELELAFVEGYAIGGTQLKIVPCAIECFFDGVVKQEGVIYAFHLIINILDNFIVSSGVGISCCRVSLGKTAISVTAPYCDECCEWPAFLI